MIIPENYKELITEQLYRYSDYLKEARKIKALIERLESKAIYPGINYSGISGNQRKDPDKTERIKLKIVDLESEYINIMLQAIEERGQLNNAINTLPEPIERTVLSYRYIFGKPWKKIQRIVDIKERQIFQIHSRAIENLKDFYFIDLPASGSGPDPVQTQEEDKQKTE